jgi:hypothetical protein
LTLVIIPVQRYTVIVGRVNRTTKKPPGAGTPNGWKGGSPMYTEYGYMVDGVEYATLDEALHRDDDD